MGGAGGCDLEAVFAVQGGSGGDMLPVGFLVGGNGGLGGSVSATVAVTAGETLNFRVAGRGGNGGASPNPFDGTLTALGGFNGGGTTSVTCNGCAFVLGGAGGGASDVRRSGDTLADRFLVAGGGGGALIGGPTVNPGTGGASATSAPSAMGGDPPFPATCTGGGAGSLTAGGAGGGGAGCTVGPAGRLGSGASAGLWVGAGGGGLYGGGAGAFGFLRWFAGHRWRRRLQLPEPREPAGRDKQRHGQQRRSQRQRPDHGQLPDRVPGDSAPGDSVPGEPGGLLLGSRQQDPSRDDGSRLAPSSTSSSTNPSQTPTMRVRSPANYLQGLGISCDRPPGYVASVRDRRLLTERATPASYPYYAKSG